MGSEFDDSGNRKKRTSSGKRSRKALGNDEITQPVPKKTAYNKGKFTTHLPKLDDVKVNSKLLNALQPRNATGIFRGFYAQLPERPFGLEMVGLKVDEGCYMYTVRGFARSPDGLMFHAEYIRSIKMGDCLLRLNDIDMTTLSLEAMRDALSKVSCPAVFQFLRYEVSADNNSKTYTNNSAHPYPLMPVESVATHKGVIVPSKPYTSSVASSAFTNHYPSSSLISQALAQVTPRTGTSSSTANRLNTTQINSKTLQVTAAHTAAQGAGLDSLLDDILDPITNDVLTTLKSLSTDATETLTQAITTSTNVTKTKPSNHIGFEAYLAGHLEKSQQKQRQLSVRPPQQHLNNDGPFVDPRSFTPFPYHAPTTQSTSTSAKQSKPTEVKAPPLKWMSFASYNTVPDQLEALFTCNDRAYFSYLSSTQLLNKIADPTKRKCILMCHPTQSYILRMFANWVEVSTFFAIDSALLSRQVMLSVSSGELYLGLKWAICHGTADQCKY